jgi:hypothetical protein
LANEQNGYKRKQKEPLKKKTKEESRKSFGILMVKKGVS